MQDKEYNADKHNSMKSISKHKITYVFDTMPLADDLRRIHGIIPPEGLHTFGSGLSKMLLGTFNDVVGIGNQIKKHKDESDRLYLAVFNGMIENQKTTCCGQ